MLHRYPGGIHKVKAFPAFHYSFEYWPIYKVLKAGISLYFVIIIKT